MSPHSYHSARYIVHTGRPGEYLYRLLSARQLRHRTRSRGNSSTLTHSATQRSSHRYSRLNADRQPSCDLAMTTMISTALISSPWHRHVLQGRPLKHSDIMATTLIVARHPFSSYGPSCLLFLSMLFGCLCVSDVIPPSRFINLVVPNSTVVSQFCSSSQGLRICNHFAEQ